MSQVTIVNIQGRDTAWPLDGIQVSYCNPNMRTYYLRWNYLERPMGNATTRIYDILNYLRFQGHIEGLIVCHNELDKEVCAVFNEKCLRGMAQSCWGVGLLEAQLRGLYTSMPDFELVHPFASYQLVAKGSYLDTLQK